MKEEEKNEFKPGLPQQHILKDVEGILSNVQEIIQKKIEERKEFLQNAPSNFKRLVEHEITMIKNNKAKEEAKKQKWQKNEN